jgi:hypothetical protein
MIFLSVGHQMKYRLSARFLAAPINSILSGQDQGSVFFGMVFVTDNDGSTTIDVADYLAACSDIRLSSQRRKQQDDECTKDERAAFRTLCGKLSYLSSASELCCVPPTAAPCLSSRFRFMRGKFYYAKSMLSQSCDKIP